ncbi:SBBP repeat-containing protein [bacterium]|nr:SBBP repeat-containing protein [bacterium]MDB4052088.1 SBBP repeat-containing protein [Flavobacteriales bacterium]MDC0015393.1 SBBP repeat-containing protein [Flavobacteriales bacterium]
MKTYILTFLFLSATFILNAQQFEWAKSFGAISNDKAYSITTDASGNVYTVGSFAGTVDFDPGVGIINLASSNGYNSAFIQKIDASGNFIWAKSLVLSH